MTKNSGKSHPLMNLTKGGASNMGKSAGTTATTLAPSKTKTKSKGK